MEKYVASIRENSISCNYKIEVSNSLLLDIACLAVPQNYVIKPQFHILVGMINEKSDLMHVLIED